jgi:hypothetical protein
VTLPCRGMGECLVTRSDSVGVRRFDRVDSGEFHLLVELVSE